MASLPLNRPGRAATLLAGAALVLGLAYIASTIGDGSARWQEILRAILYLSSAVLAVLATIFGALGMWHTPKRNAVVGFVLGIVAFVGVPGYLVARYAIDENFDLDRTGLDGYSTYRECMADPNTSYSDCAHLD